MKQEDIILKNFTGQNTFKFDEDYDEDDEEFSEVLNNKIKKHQKKTKFRSYRENESRF